MPGTGSGTRTGNDRVAAKGPRGHASPSPRSHLALVALTATACTSAKAPGWTFPAATAPAAAAASAPAAGVDQPAGTPGTAEAAATGTIEIESFDLGFTPAAITVPAAGTYEVKLVNTGIDHARRHLRRRHGHRSRGRTDRNGTVTIPADGLGFICSIPGHKDAGMAGIGQRRRRHGRRHDGR